MKKTLHISTGLDKQSLLENMVEKLAGHRSNYVNTGIKMPRGLEAIESSSAEAYITGTVEFNFLINKSNKDYIRMPFITSFHFTCIKTKNSPFRLTWSSSLS